MTKKHFEAIASILKEADLGECMDPHCQAGNAVEQITRDLGRYFITQNERFDFDRFVEACGLDPEVI